MDPPPAWARARVGRADPPCPATADAFYAATEPLLDGLAPWLQAAGLSIQGGAGTSRMWAGATTPLLALGFGVVDALLALGFGVYVLWGGVSGPVSAALILGLAANKINTRA